MKNIFIPSSQPNLNLSISIHEPAGEPKGIVILCPGYLDTKDYPDLIELAKDLVQEGYVVARFDPLGTWASDGDIDLYSLQQYQQDIISIQEYMLREYDNLPIIIGGKSMGGMMSIIHAAKYSELIEKVFGIVPPRGNKVHPKDQQWKDAGFRISQRNKPGDPESFQSFEIPYETISEIHSFNLLSVLPYLQAPLLLIAGGKDTTVPPEVVQEIYDEVLGEKKIVMLKQIEHDYRKDLKHVSLVNEQIREWLQN